MTSSGECSRAPDGPIKATGATRAPNTGPPDPPTEAAAYSEASEQKFFYKDSLEVEDHLRIEVCQARAPFSLLTQIEGPTGRFQSMMAVAELEPGVRQHKAALAASRPEGSWEAFNGGPARQGTLLALVLPGR